LKTELGDKTVDTGESHATTVEILGREYRIRGSADESYIREVARYVDAKLREVSRSSTMPASDRAAILAAMNIADELFQLRRASAEDLARIEHRTLGLIRLLEENLSAQD
jgi:cell division protein ZapA